MSSSASEIAQKAPKLRPGNKAFKANNEKRKVPAIAFLNGNKFIITCSPKDCLQAIDTKTGKPVGDPWQDRQESSPICAYTVSPDGKFIATGSKDGKARLWSWNGRAAKMVSKSMKYTSAVNCLRWSPSGNHIASGFDDGRVAVWPMELKDPISTNETRLRHVYSIDYSHDGTQLIASGYGSKFSVLRINDRTREIELVNISGVCSNPHQVQCVTWARKTDGYSIVTGSTDGKIRVRPSGKSIELEIEGHSGLVSAVVASPDNRILASVSDDCTLRLWDLDAMRSIGPPLQHDMGLSCAAFATGGALLATGTRDGMIYLWEISDLLNATTVHNKDTDDKVKVRPLQDQTNLTTRAPSSNHEALRSSRYDDGFWIIDMDRETRSSHSDNNAANDTPRTKTSTPRRFTMPRHVQAAAARMGKSLVVVRSRKREPVAVEVPVIQEAGTRRRVTRMHHQQRTPLDLTNNTRSRRTSAAEPISGDTGSRSTSAPGVRVRHDRWCKVFLQMGCLTAEPD